MNELAWLIAYSLAFDVVILVTLCILVWLDWESDRG